MTLKTVKPGAVIVACVLAMAGTAGAQTTANITIDGTFVPPSCAVSISGGGTVDYGTMTRATVLAYGDVLGVTGFRALPTKTAQLSVVCPSATVVGLSWVDNRAANRLAMNADDVIRFGLGNANIPAQGLGAYYIEFGTPTSTTGGAINAAFRQPETGGAWSTAPLSTNSNAYEPTPGYVTAFGRTSVSPTAPAPLLDFTALMTIRAGVSTAVVTASTSSILIDGSATVTLKYF